MRPPQNSSQIYAYASGATVFCIYAAAILLSWMYVTVIRADTKGLLPLPFIALMTLNLRLLTAPTIRGWDILGGKVVAHIVSELAKQVYTKFWKMINPKECQRPATSLVLHISYVKYMLHLEKRALQRWLESKIVAKVRTFDLSKIRGGSNQIRLFICSSWAKAAQFFCLTAIGGIRSCKSCNHPGKTKSRRKCQRT